jgi:ribonuclease HI
MSKIIYCDGSSLGNPGPAGFGVVAIDSQRKLVWEYGGGFKKATNNQMELAACIFSLKLILKSVGEEISRGGEFELRLDSKYVIQGATVWSKGWLKNGWKNAQKKEVLNKEYWQEILGLISEIETKRIKLVWTHVYGHTGETWNERCDEIAKGMASGENLVLKKGEKF